MLDAGERLASIEFSVCPRCMQSLTQRQLPDGTCRVCLQPDPVAAAPGTGDDPYETRQLRDQISEMDGQLEAITTQLAADRQAVADREQLVKHLSAAIDERTATRITPRLQAFSDAVQRFAAARARRGELELVLRQWDRADDIGVSAERLRSGRERLRSEIVTAQTALDERRREILAALNEEFRETVRALGIPGIQTAAIRGIRDHVGLQRLKRTTEYSVTFQKAGEEYVLPYDPEGRQAKREVGAAVPARVFTVATIDVWRLGRSRRLTRRLAALPPCSSTASG
jgi:hypothetical protein